MIENPEEGKKWTVSGEAVARAAGTTIRSLRVVFPMPHQNGFLFDTHVEHSEPVTARVGAVAGSQIEAQVMAAADHLTSFEPAAIQRFVLVRTERGGGEVVPALGMEQGAVRVVTHRDKASFSRRNVADSRYRIEDFSHREKSIHQSI